MIEVAAGSQEQLRISITDHRGLLIDLSTASPKYELKDSAGAFVFGDGTYANAIATTASGMVIYPEVDHTGLSGDYALYVWFVDGTQEVRRGPYWYRVVA